MSFRGACLLAAALAAGAASPAAAQAPHVRVWPPEGEDRFFDPPPALPQDIHGVIRASAPAAAVPRIDRIRDVFPAVRACWEPGLERHGQLTIRLAFKRSGELLGPPRVTYAEARDNESRRATVERVVTALQRCTPLPFSQSFGAAVAGRPFTFRFIDDRSI